MRSCSALLCVGRSLLSATFPSAEIILRGPIVGLAHLHLARPQLVMSVGSRIAPLIQQEYFQLRHNSSSPLLEPHPPPSPAGWWRGKHADGPLLPPRFDDDAYAAHVTLSSSSRALMRKHALSPERAAAILSQEFDQNIGPSSVVDLSVEKLHGFLEKTKMMSAGASDYGRVGLLLDEALFAHAEAVSNRFFENEVFPRGRSTRLMLTLIYIYTLFIIQTDFLLAMLLFRPRTYYCYYYYRKSRSAVLYCRCSNGSCFIHPFVSCLNDCCADSLYKISTGLYRLNLNC